MQNPVKDGVITVKPFRPQPGMGPQGRGPEINYEEGAAFREAVAAKKAAQEAAEAPEEPALLSFKEFFDDDELVGGVDRRNRFGSWLAG